LFARISSFMGLFEAIVGQGHDAAPALREDR
jgi:hypothetical protein